MSLNWREDKTLIVLSFFIIASGVVFLVTGYFPPKDPSLMSVARDTFLGFTGALVLHLRSDRAAPAGSETTVDTHQQTTVPPVEVSK